MFALLLFALVRAVAATDDTCQLWTGGVCGGTMAPCDPWRNAVCHVIGQAGNIGHCMCPSGSCAVNGECVPTGGCPKYTNGTCAVLGCSSYRNAQCAVRWWGHSTVLAKCLCSEGDCAVHSPGSSDGFCVAASDATCTHGDCVPTTSSGEGLSLTAAPSGIAGPASLALVAGIVLTALLTTKARGRARAADAEEGGDAGFAALPSGSEDVTGAK